MDHCSFHEQIEGCLRSNHVDDAIDHIYQLPLFCDDSNINQVVNGDIIQNTKHSACHQKYSESYQMRVSSEEKGRALITLKNTNLLQFHDEDVAGNLLDWAIAAKRAGLMHECIQAIQVS